MMSSSGAAGGAPGGGGMPTYAPANVLNHWQSGASLYNANPRVLHKWWAAAQKLALGVRSAHVGFFGDSTAVGFDGTTFNSDRTIPRQFGRKLASILGGVSFTDGFRAPIGSGGGSANDRWTLTGGFLTSGALALLTSLATAGTATWVSLDAGTSVDVEVSNLSTTNIAWTIDGVAQAAIVTTGASTLQKITVNGLPNTTHTVVFTCAAGANQFIAAPRVYSPGGVQLHVHNLAIGGSRANSGAAGQNWSNTTATGLGNIAALELSAGGIALDLAVIMAGNNDAAAGIAAATTLAGIVTMRANLAAGVPTVIVRPPMVPGTDPTLYTALCSGGFTQADSLDTVLWDWNDFVQGIANFQADGLAGADNTHPVFAHQLAVGSQLAQVLAPWR